MDGVEFGVGILCVMGGVLLGYVVSIALDHAILKTHYGIHLEYLHDYHEHEEQGRKR